MAKFGGLRHYNRTLGSGKNVAGGAHDGNYFAHDHGVYKGQQLHHQLHCKADLNEHVFLVRFMYAKL
jgi:hypothetical protein